MCGLIAAFTDTIFPKEAADRALVRLARRGPDWEGRWTDDGVFLGHRRLAILDLNARASQPMQSACGRYVIVFNGEIYNYRDLRNKLEAKGELFETTSDTEVVLKLFKLHGVKMLHRLRGMFAIVIWDKLERKALAARDPYGIKPLYIGSYADGVILASQVKALLATGLISREADARGQVAYWMLGSVPEPHTWFSQVTSVRAGHYIWIENSRITDQCCWHDIGKAWLKQGSQRVPKSSKGLVYQSVREALIESVQDHLTADVPIGVFLSGGIDSGTMAALMAEVGVNRLMGVTIAYDEFQGKKEDEAPLAAQVAAQYGIQHHIRRVTYEEFRNDVPRILDAMDQPSIDGVNTWFASKAVAELGLKVVISGIGGDELFLGYESFKTLPRLTNYWGRMAGIPGSKPLASFLLNLQAKHTRNNRWSHAVDWAKCISGAWWLRRSCMAPPQVLEFVGPDVASEVLRDFSPQNWVREMTGPLSETNLMALAQIESMTYLRNQLLRDSDWASMDHGIELRTPLVDVRLLESLSSVIPQFQYYRNKSLLAKAPKIQLPRDITRKRKTGFAIPIKQWMDSDTEINGTWQSVVGQNWLAI